MSSEAPRKLTLAVEAGSLDRFDTIVQAPVGLPAGTAVALRERGAYAPTPAQVDSAGNLVWLLAGRTRAGATRRVAAEVVPGEPEQRVAVELHPAVVTIAVEGKLIAQYNYRSVWKPYFWPLVGPTGNVLRGAAGEHQHQAGLYFSYGGHFTPTNIYSDWDEPIYGPDGKILHVDFDVLTGGPVFAELVERTYYMAAAGDHLLDEARRMRVYPLPGGVVAVDMDRTCGRPKEHSDGPFGISLRVAEIMRTIDMSRWSPPPDRHMLPTENPGKMEGADGQVSRQDPIRSERWMDVCGQLPGGWGGVALFEHPSNPGYPRGVSASGWGPGGSGCPFPAGAAEASWRYRVYAHAGDAQEGSVEAAWQGYANPPTVSVD